MSLPINFITPLIPVMLLPSFKNDECATLRRLYVMAGLTAIKSLISSRKTLPAIFHCKAVQPGGSIGMNDISPVMDSTAPFVSLLNAILR